MIVRLPDDIINTILDFLVPCTVCTETMTSNAAARCCICHRSWCPQCKPTAHFRRTYRECWLHCCLYCYMVDLRGTIL